MRRRQESVDQTRARIAEAAFDLHAAIGPAQTTISAIAERAGVQRHTVYRHFPDLETLFRACTAHGMRVTRFPHGSAWRVVEHPVERLRLGLSELYAYYRANTRLVGNITRDAPLFEGVGGDEEFEERVAEMHDALTEPWAVRDEATNGRLRTAISHAMAFETWQSLTQYGMSDDDAREMMITFVTGIVGGAGAPEPGVASGGIDGATPAR
jgi:AcrR family transcriptional regulator